MCPIEPESSLGCFLDGAPEAIVRALTVLSAAPALTDELACHLIGKHADPAIPPQEIVDVLHCCDFVAERNSEWHLVPEARLVLLSSLQEDRDLAREVHSTLAEIAEREHSEPGRDPVPTYLSWGVGRAYHTTVIDAETGLDLYRRSVPHKPTGEQWMLAALCDEQQRYGWIPQDAVEPAFFLGMLAYREGRVREAERSLRRVSDSGRCQHEVAVAKHVLAVIVCRLWFRADEAEELFRQSLSIEEELHNKRGQAQVMHSLAKHISHSKHDEAGRLFRQSLSIEEELHNKHGQAQVLHSLAKHISHSKHDEAEGLFRQSLSFLEELHDRHGQAQVLHSLAKHISHSKPDEAEKLFRESLRIGEEIGHKDHQGQVLNSLGDHYRAEQDWESARSSYLDALERSANPKTMAVAHLGLSRISEEFDGDLESACDHMRLAVAAQRRTGMRYMVRSHENRLRILEDRLHRRR